MQPVSYHQVFFTDYTKMQEFKPAGYESAENEIARRITCKSRAYDFRSLAIILVFILDHRRLHDIQNNFNGPVPRQIVVKIEEIDPVQLCNKPDSPVYSLLPLVREIASYKYFDTPNYEKLRHIFKNILLDNGKVPKLVYDFVAE